MHDLLEVRCGEVEGLVEFQGLKGALKVIAGQTLYYKLFIIFTKGSRSILISSGLAKEFTDFPYLIGFFLVVNYRFNLRNQCFFLFHCYMKSSQLFIDMLIICLLVSVNH
jgi:hypothetical protein